MSLRLVNICSGVSVFMSNPRVSINGRIRHTEHAHNDSVVSSIATRSAKMAGVNSALNINLQAKREKIDEKSSPIVPNWLQHSYYQMVYTTILLHSFDNVVGPYERCSLL